MSEIDTIISEIQSQSNRANIDEPDFKSSFDKLFNDTENEVVDILNRYELINDNTYVDVKLNKIRIFRENMIRFTKNKMKKNHAYFVVE